MRYVGRHRAPRPLLLRRPVVGGVAAAALLTVPVLYATGSFSGAIQGGTPSKQIADGATKTSDAPLEGDEEQTDAAPEPRTTATVGNDGGYGKSARDGLKQLIEGKSAGR